MLTLIIFSNDLHNYFTTDGSDRGLDLSVTSNKGLMIELRMSVVKSRVTFMCVFVFRGRLNR